MKLFPNGTVLGAPATFDPAEHDLLYQFLTVNIFFTGFLCNLYIAPPGLVTPHTVYNNVLQPTMYRFSSAFCFQTAWVG